MLCSGCLVRTWYLSSSNFSSGLIGLLAISAKSRPSSFCKTHKILLQRRRIDEIRQSRRILQVARCFSFPDSFILQPKRVKLCSSATLDAKCVVPSREQVTPTHQLVDPPHPPRQGHRSFYRGFPGFRSLVQSSLPCRSECSGCEPHTSIWPKLDIMTHLNLVNINPLVLLLHLLVGDLHSVHRCHLSLGLCNWRRSHSS